MVGGGQHRGRQSRPGGGQTGRRRGSGGVQWGGSYVEGMACGMSEQGVGVRSAGGESGHVFGASFWKRENLDPLSLRTGFAEGRRFRKPFPEREHFFRSLSEREKLSARGKTVSFPSTGSF